MIHEYINVGNGALYCKPCEVLVAERDGAAAVRDMKEHEADPCCEAECACYLTDPKTWTRYGGSVEPGSAFEPNPECRVHFTDEERNYALGLDGGAK